MKPPNENPAVVGGALKTSETAVTFARNSKNVNTRFCRSVKPHWTRVAAYYLRLYDLTGDPWALNVFWSFFNGRRKR